MKKLFFIVTLYFLSSCRSNVDLQKIVSTERYFRHSQPFDNTPVATKEFLKSAINKKTICGNYNFIVWAGYDGHELILNPDSTFKENHWTDVVSFGDNSINGKWKIRNGDIILKYRHRTYQFIYFEYKWAIFLIPETKLKLFNSQFEKNKVVLDNLTDSAEKLPGYTMQDTLSFFAELCFIKFPTKN